MDKNVDLTIRVDKGCGGKIEEYKVARPLKCISHLAQYCEMVRNFSNKHPVLRANRKTLCLISDRDISFVETPGWIAMWCGYRAKRDELLPDYHIGIEPLEDEVEEKIGQLGFGEITAMGLGEVSNRKRIKPCPCCGTEVHYQVEADAKDWKIGALKYKVVCSLCELATAWHDSIELAQKSWNCRVKCEV